MTRPSDWSPVGYASDPVPGDPTRVQVIGRMYVGTADAIDRAATNLSTALRDDFGQAQVLDAIREQAEEVARRIGMAEERYRGVGDAMIAYAGVLAQAQRESEDALTDAVGAASTASTARWWVDYYQDRIADPATPPANLADLAAKQSLWQGRLASANASQGGAQSAIAAAVTSRDTAAATAIAEIRLVENSGDLNDGFWDNVSQWVDENQELLDIIGTVLEVITTVVLVAALLVPGLNVLATIALVAITVNLVYQTASSVVQVATGNMSVGEAILNVGFAVLNFVGVGAIARTALRTGSAAAMAGFRALPGATRAGARSSVRAILSSTSDNVLAPLVSKGLDELGLAAGGVLTRLLPSFTAPRLAGLDVIANMVGTGGAAIAPGVQTALQAAYVQAGLLTAGSALGEQALSPVFEAMAPDSVTPWRVTGDGLPIPGRW